MARIPVEVVERLKTEVSVQRLDQVAGGYAGRDEECALPSTARR
jgi:hypothetical protein